MTTVLRGRVELLMDGDRHEFTRGHSIRVPAGTPHAIRAADGEGAETLNVFPAESS